MSLLRCPTYDVGDLRFVDSSHNKKEGETEQATTVTASAAAQAIGWTRTPPLLAHPPGYTAVHDLKKL